MKVKLMFVGDFCAKNPQNIKLSDSLVEVVKSCDIKCINFEAPLAYGELCSPNMKNLDQSIDSPNWAEGNNFDIIAMANNHMLDYGAEGLLATKNAFKKSITIGAGSWEEAYEVKYISIKGIKIGFFSATSADFASLKDEWTDKDKIGCAWINQKDVNNIINSAKLECDYLIILTHGGVEFMDVPLPEWRDRYRQLIDIGADAVIGSHPHVPQGVEIYKEKPIFYSLGNFFFDNDNAKKPLYWDSGVLAILEIENGTVNCLSIPIVKDGDFLDIDSSDKIKKHLEYLTEILTDDIKYINKVNQDVLLLYNKYMSWLMSSINSVEVGFNKRSLKMLIKTIFFGKQNYKATLHQIREESTRWLLIRALKLKSKTEL